MSDVNQKSLSSRALPAVISPNTYGPDRSSRYGEKAVQPYGNWRHNLADEGTYFTWHNVTVDSATTVVGHAAPVVADIDATFTKPLIFMRNTDAITSTKRVYLDWIEIEVVTAAANGTDALWADELDTGATRYSSGSGETATVVNPNMQSTATSVMTTFLGPVVVGAESANARYLGHGKLRVAIEFTGDRVTFVYGGDPRTNNIVLGAATHSIVNRPPVILGPTDQYMLALAGVSTNTAGVYKIRGCYYER